ncbi:hypothetical protein BDW02DRAFT_495096, partial [Decorospora gaudefroyi]
FKVIERLLQDLAVLVENVYNIDKTSVILLILSLAKVLVGKSNMRSYRGARVKRKIVTAIKCISANSRYLNPLII